MLTPRLDLIELDQIPTEVWTLLELAVRDALHPFHLPVLATVNGHGPSQRTVVLRHVEPGNRTLVCHTDRRSAKLDEISSDPRASWLFYDAGGKLQLRLSGRVTFHHDDEFADLCWAQTAPRSRACYRAAQGPGVSISEPQTPATASTVSPHDSGRDNFAALACRIDFLDWLVLHARGHRRAQFVWRDGVAQGTWVTP